MKIDALKSPRGAVTAFLLFLAGLALAWCCFQTSVSRVLPATSPLSLALDPENPRITLGLAIAKVAQVKPGSKATLDEADLEAVRRVAATEPLNEQPYLILGRQNAIDGDSERATSLLEAGQRLDPRNRLIDAFLLERYLLDQQYEKAAEQFSLLSRLVGRANTPITKALVAMATDPRTLPAVRRTLQTDPALEQRVLLALANGDAEAARIFDLASPTAIKNAGAEGSWGPALIGRLVSNGRYRDARAIWRRIYQIAEAQAAAPIYNSDFERTVGSPPFNWTLTANSLGAADPGKQGLSVEYYGRESGSLASQTLVLKPGRYRLTFASEGGKSNTASGLFWRISCATGKNASLINLPVGD
ncbi:tetratricopeptide repeat protein [Novosphingopyxis sp. YJ-S2-01]|uniref:tetratricopeptide repeat protein n=1 Tax=Novosphingopyxis sp. YJ-S2-01 TaxID=2794021 RepID=UPI0018DE6636|nr:hypothetical protein [Novosphingopyxis sp. YJ-S2-01]MBH9538431.1 hypothetical protein [Novosphingopyxis sp. YJ-S2-01]